MMGGLGRSIDGSYAEYTVVDAANVIPFASDLPWETLGALPEMLQAAHGSLTVGLALQAGQSILIHGGTSTVGLTAIAVAHNIGARVIATTRNPARFDLLKEVGADHAVLDDDALTDKVNEIAPEGLDAVLELVNAPELPRMLRLVRAGGTVCFTGALAGEWTIPEFSPFSIPNGTRLASCGGTAANLPAPSLQHYLDAIAAGTMTTVHSNVYSGLDEVATAHRALEGNDSPGKQVVVLATT
jgi:NADPH:quinone reductase-like Zn-dependent oxidoreductase